jgi:site-specific DNA-methyltransferase (adenine-specific)
MARVGKGEEGRSNALYHGDNLYILREYIQDETIDLVYLDPPFQSGRDYNLLFKSADGTRPPALIKAFTDTWHWDMAAKDAFDELVTSGADVGLALAAIERVMPRTPMLAYLAMMAVRLVELRRVLKKTGSLYLHCDPTASHYLKMVLDAVFGPSNFRNEIVWNYEASGLGTVRRTSFPMKHDIIFWYSAGADYVYQPQLRDYKPEYKALYKKDAKGWYRPKWRVLPDGTKYKVKQRMKEGVPISDVWSMPSLTGPHKERLGFPTQKPLALVERIVQASSREGDLVLDPFCGCGTTIHAAQALKRRWIGIDIAKQAVDIIQERLLETFGEIACRSYTLLREPGDLEGARALANEDRFQFQRWAIGIAGVAVDEVKRGADSGIDGVLTFREAPASPVEKAIISVKSGKVSVRDVRDLWGTIEREHAVIGVLITLHPPTDPMRSEAASCGWYQTRLSNHPEKYPRLQILTVEELLEGAEIRAPMRFRRKGPRRKSPQTVFAFADGKA